MMNENKPKYIDFCMNIIGNYLHTPGSEWTDPEKARAETLEWYYKLHDILNGEDEV